MQGMKYNWKYDCSKGLLYMIRKARYVNPLDILGNYANVPSTFMPSFILHMHKQMKCLGGCVFDIFQNYSTIKEQIKSTYNTITKALEYKLEPNKPTMSAEITLIRAMQIPFPDEKKLSLNLVKSRAVKIGIYSTKYKEFVANSTVVYPLPLNPKSKNSWLFSKEHPLNIIQVTVGSNMKEEDQFALNLIFEFTMVIEQGKECIDMSCGFCTINLRQLNAKGSLKLELTDGSPGTNADGMAQNLLNQSKGNKRFLLIDYRPLAKYSEGRKIQVGYMPQLYVIPAKAMYYVSIIRQYIAEKLLETNFDVTKLLPETMYMSSLKALNSPDTMELLLPYIKTQLM